MQNDLALSVIADAPAPDSAPVGRSAATIALTRGVWRLFTDLGLAPLPEFRLPNGRRADLAGLERAGRLVIAEIKSCQADFDADAKWSDYLGYCDAFYFAVGEGFPVRLLPPETGLIVADGFGGAVLRAAPERPLAPSRRRALTLRFARQSALRAVTAAGSV